MAGVDQAPANLPVVPELACSAETDIVASTGLTWSGLRGDNVHMTSTPTTNLHPLHRQLVAPDIKSLAAFLRRCDRWDKVVASQHTDKPLPFRGNPSKASKHQAYASADRIIRLLVLDVVRPSTLVDLRVVLAAAETY